MTIPAWEGDWERRIYDRVFERDFRNLSAFAESRPTATLMQLADELGPQDVAAVQLETLLRSEAQRDGCVHRFARGVLVREVHKYFPQGWMRGEDADFARASVYAKWRSRIGEEYDAATDSVWASLKKSAPVGWLPSGPDDSIILHAFREGGFPEDGETSKVGGTSS
jgi:hypothetical protein